MRRWMWWDDEGPDVLDVPGALKDAVGFLPSSAKGTWLLRLRELYGKAIDNRREMFGKSIDSGVRGDEQRLHKMLELIAFDRQLAGQLNALSRRLRDLDEDDAEIARIHERGAVIVRDAYLRFARLLNLADPEPPPSWGWVSTGRRGPDKAPGMRPPKPRKAPAPKLTGDAKRVQRILVALARHPDGLSAKALQPALKKVTGKGMGRAELRRALVLGLTLEVLEQRGSLENPRYCARSGGVAETGSRKSRGT
jgi:hypothetical protein